MKKTVLILSIACFSGWSYAQTIIPNGDFEAWNDQAGYLNPDQWGNTNEVMGDMGIYTVTKGTPGNPGNSYIKVTSQTHMSTPIPGIAVCGSLNITDLTVSPGIATTDRPESLKGNWQYMAMSVNDQGFIGVLFTKWNDATQSRDTIGQAYQALDDMVMSWASFEIPITYLSSETPDSALIILAASGAGTEITPNSYLYIDDLSFSGGGSAISAVDAGLSDILVSPNPASDKLRISYTNNKPGLGISLTITDVQGRIVHREKQLEHPAINIDISRYTSGIYMLQLTDGKTTHTRKISIK